MCPAYRSKGAVEPGLEDGPLLRVREDLDPRGGLLAVYGLSIALAGSCYDLYLPAYPGIPPILSPGLGSALLDLNVRRTPLLTR